MSDCGACCYALFCPCCFLCSFDKNSKVVQNFQKNKIKFIFVIMAKSLIFFRNAAVLHVVLACALEVQVL